MRALPLSTSEQYIGKMVRVRASAVGDLSIDDFEQTAGLFLMDWDLLWCFQRCG